MDQTSIVKGLIEKFSSLEKQYQGPIEDSVFFDFGGHDFHCVFSSIIHGDEFGTLPGFIRAIEDISKNKIKYKGKITFILGNKNAALKGKRFIDKDLNRLFSYGPCLNKCEEQERANNLLHVIETANLVIDFHQTIEPTDHDFIIYSENEVNNRILKEINWTHHALVASNTGLHGVDTVNMREFATSCGIPSFTYEVSQKGFYQEAEEKTYQSIINSLALAQDVGNGVLNLDKKASLDAASIIKFKVESSISFDDAKTCLKTDIVNFSAFECGDTIGYRSDSEPLRMPVTGFVLFPKFPKRDSEGAAIGQLPNNICVIAREIF